MTSVGIDSIPNTKVIRHTIQGLSFNLMVAGPSGGGKTTLINSLFDADYNDTPNNDNQELSIKEYCPENKSMKIKLTIIETKNMGAKSPIYKSIVDYIEAKNEEYFKDELDVKHARPKVIPDNRVHCCIYMIVPNKYGLDSKDILTMKELGRRVCLVPVVAKSDQLTISERISIKKTIMKQIIDNDIEIYSPKEYELPFFVVASDDIINENGKLRRVRQFPYCRAYIEEISDFLQLRDLILRSHMFPLITNTAKVHYEKYRNDSLRDIQEHYRSEILPLIGEQKLARSRKVC